MRHKLLDKEHTFPCARAVSEAMRRNWTRSLRTDFSFHPRKLFELITHRSEIAETQKCPFFPVLDLDLFSLALLFFAFPLPHLQHLGKIRVSDLNVA